MACSKIRKWNVTCAPDRRHQRTALRSLRRIAQCTFGSTSCRPAPPSPPPTGLRTNVSTASKTTRSTADRSFQRYEYHPLCSWMSARRTASSLPFIRSTSQCFHRKPRGVACKHAASASSGSDVPMRTRASHRFQSTAVDPTESGRSANGGGAFARAVQMWK